MVTAAIGGILAGLSGLSGLLNNRPKTTTTKTETSSKSANTASTRRYMTPFQQALMDAMGEHAQNLLQYPGAGLEPLRLAGRNQVNAQYAGVPGKLASDTLAHGGRSGAYNSGMRSMERSRLGAIAGVDAETRRLMLDRQDAGASLAMQIASMNMGDDAESSASQSGTSTSTGTTPGNQLGGAVGAGSETLATLLMLRSLMGSK